MLPTQIGLDWIPWVDVANRVQRTGGERQCTTKNWNFPIAISLFLKLQPLNGVNYFKHTFKNDLFLKLNCSVANHVFSPEVTTREDFDCVCLGVYLAVHTGLLQDHQFSVQTSSASYHAYVSLLGLKRMLSVILNKKNAPTTVCLMQNCFFLCMVDWNRKRQGLDEDKLAL